MISRIVVALFCLCLISCTFAATHREQFEHFKKNFGKSYHSDAENDHRFAIFSYHLDFIEQHNMEHAQGMHTFTVGINEYADLALHEFTSMVNGYRAKTGSQKREVVPVHVSSTGLPSSVDWRQSGAVTPIKNQGQCGSCWSFSTTGCIEAQHFFATGTLVSLSEQNLIDCSTSYGNNGCNGGMPDYAFQYVIANKGIDTEASYPYQTAGPLQCRYSTSHIGSTLVSYNDLPSGSESALQQASATYGPISVGIDASHTSFQLYKSGVYYEPACGSSPNDLDHAVLVVGYGTDNGQAYWLVKNSWGTTWGMQGYIEMSRNRGNNCGIATAASRCSDGTNPSTSSGGSSSSSGYTSGDMY